MTTPYRSNSYISETSPSKYTKLISWIKSFSFDPEKILVSLGWIVGVLVCLSAIIFFVCLGYEAVTGHLFQPSAAERICEAAKGIHDPRCVGYFGHQN